MPKTRFSYRHQYDDARDAEERENTDIHCLDHSLTQQHFKDDVDLNCIVKRYGITDGAIPPAPADPRYYGDFSDAVDFREAMDRINEAQQRFSELPADLRSRFHNDPVLLHDWVSDPANQEEAVKLKLLTKKETPLPEAPPEPLA